MNSVIKDPPRLNDEEKYESWKRDVKIWCELTTLEKPKHAMAIHLSLSGKARIATSELSLDDLKLPNAVDLILTKLDDVFLPDQSRRQFSAFKKLYGLRRTSEKGIKDFIVEFDHVYYEFVLQGMELPDSVMAFMLLASCNFDENAIQLVMSAVPIVSYENMKAAIRRIFEGSIKMNNSEGTQDVVVKSEPTLVADSAESDVLYNRSYGRSRSGNRRPYNRGGSRNRGYSYRGNRQLNPTTAVGEVTRCVVCDSKMHWARECPHSYENAEKKNSDSSSNEQEKEHRETNFVMSVYTTNTNSSNGKMSKLLKDSQGCAILDSGCITTVCGKEWFDSYTSQLSDYQKSFLKEEPSESTFTFGDGKSVQSLKRVSLPCSVAGFEVDIVTDVVECSIPLLLSKTSMKKAEMKLDFKNDIVYIKNKPVKLNCTSSGHYALPLTL